MDPNHAPPPPHLSAQPHPPRYGELSLAMRPRCLGPDPSALNMLSREDMDRIHAATRKRLRKGQHRA